MITSLAAWPLPASGIWTISKSLKATWLISPARFFPHASSSALRPPFCPFPRDHRAPSPFPLSAVRSGVWFFSCRRFDWSRLPDSAPIPATGCHWGTGSIRPSSLTWRVKLFGSLRVTWKCFSACSSLAQVCELNPPFPLIRDQPASFVEQKSRILLEHAFVAAHVRGCEALNDETAVLGNDFQLKRDLLKNEFPDCQQRVVPGKDYAWLDAKTRSRSIERPATTAKLGFWFLV